MKSLLSILFVSCAINAIAQLDNSSFYNARPLDPTRVDELYLDFDALLFTRNNEYFNKVADGYTLYGFQFAPFFSYYPSEHVRIDAGVYLQKDFGNENFNEILPILSVKFKLGPFEQIIGNLDGSLNHQYIEPLYDIERVMIDRQETGMQTKFMNETTFFDLWVSWETMIYKRDPNLEEVSGGISFYKDKWWGNHRLRIPFQFIAYHQGGQIDFNPEKILTLWNHSLGLSYDYFFNGFIKKVHVDGYYAYYQNFTPSRRLAFDDGDGWYSNVSLTTRFNLELMASYWVGNEFISIKGGQLYQSISSAVHHEGHVEPKRELIILRLMHNLKVSDNVNWTARFEPFYDLQNTRWDYSWGFYLNYYPDFFVTKFKK
jgi:hypothetical protein